MSSTIRPTATNVTVSFGLVSFPVDLMAATKKKTAKATTDSTSVSTTLICPTCNANNNITPLRQTLVCDADGGHGQFSRDDAATAFNVNGELVTVRPEQAAAVRQVDGVRGVIELTVHPAAEVEECTYPSGNIYWLRPRENEAHYGLVLELARDRQVAFICEVTNKGATLLYRLVERAGRLVLTELVRPDRINETGAMPDVSYDPKLLATGRSLVESLMEPFDPAAYVDRRKERLAALAEKLRGDAPVAAPASEAAVTAGDLLDLLQRSLDAAA